MQSPIAISKRFLRFMVLLGAGLGLSARTVPAASFVGLGDLPGGQYRSFPTAISDNGGGGAVVVGESWSASGIQAFRWSYFGGMVGLGYLPGDNTSYAKALSANGAVIVGVSDSAAGGYRAFRWTAATGMQEIGPGTAVATSSDGNVVIIEGVNDLRWTPGGTVALTFPGYPMAVSADANIIVGRGAGPDGAGPQYEAIRWHLLTGEEGLGDLAGGDFKSEARDVTPNGAVVVGRGYRGPFGAWSSETWGSFRWTAATGLVDLGFMSNQNPTPSWANAVSADGSVIVGRVVEPISTLIEAYIWDAQHGMRILEDVLENDYGLGAVIDDWALTEAVDISADGKYIVGRGMHRVNGVYQDEGWIANLNAVCGNGVKEGDDEECDDGNTVNGDCCTSNCQLVPQGTVCRAATGGCDLTEVCNATGHCPPDLMKNAQAICRPSAGACDEPDWCDGVSKDCPADELKPAGYVCRWGGGECDQLEYCDGGSAICPPDGFAAAGLPCSTDDKVCTDDVCSGTGLGCQHVPKAAGTECRAANGECDVAETCDGSDDDCPADTFQPPTVECRASAGDCDSAEHCSGTSATCPADSKQPAGFVCRDTGGNTCDAEEVCDGTSDACPADETLADGSSCDDAESCTDDDICSAGVCIGDDVCQIECPPVPLDGCKQPTAQKRSWLSIRRTPATPRRDRLAWWWERGEETDMSELGDPVNGQTGYRLCAYDANGLFYEGTLVAQGTCDGKPCWQQTRRGLRYRDADAMEDGIARLRITTGAGGRTRLTVSARNYTQHFTPSLLAEPPYDGPVIIQLSNGVDQCWAAEFDDAVRPFGRNKSGNFRARSTMP